MSTAFAEVMSPFVSSFVDAPGVTQPFLETNPQSPVGEASPGVLVGSPDWMDGYREGLAKGTEMLPELVRSLVADRDEELEDLMSDLRAADERAEQREMAADDVYADYLKWHDEAEHRVETLDRELAAARAERADLANLRLRLEDPSYRQCDHCDCRIATAARSDSRFCNARCRTAAWRERSK